MKNTLTRIALHLDEKLLEYVREGSAPWGYRLWEPEEVVVVLGRGNKANVEANEAHCEEAGVPILRRRGGGGTVVLAPGVLVISLITHVAQQYQFAGYFHQINDLIIDALQRVGMKELNQQGHSDICLGERKILGSSMYRSRDILFYTASLMVSNSLSDIERYLKHPSKEPEYRHGRSHLDFVTTVQREYPALTLTEIHKSIEEVFRQRIAEIQ